MSDSNVLVIEVVDGQPINHPLTYSNFLLLYPECPRQDIPSNDILEQYGYQTFIRTSAPILGTFDHPYTSGPYVFENGTWVDSWIPVPFSPEEVQARIDKEWKTFRIKRNFYLTRSDWVFVVDSPVADEEKQQWITYRQVLRDLPLSVTDPFNINWPIPPREIEIQILPLKAIR